MECWFIKIYANSPQLKQKSENGYIWLNTPKSNYSIPHINFGVITPY